MQNPTSELTTLLSTGIEAVFHVGEYQVQLWKRQEGGLWRAAVAWYGDGVPLAESTGATPAEALWNLCMPDDGGEPYAGDFAGLPARLRAFTDALEAAAVARAEAEDSAAARCVAVAAA
jgi:hypothetical protein